MSTHDLFDAYERRFANVMSTIPDRKPWLESDRLAIRSTAKECIGVKDEWTPEIRAETLKTIKQENYSVEFITFTSWQDVIGTALLYLPEEVAGEKPPLVILCCGHGANGKLCPGYQAMARRLARQGSMVIVPDNIGQGERAPMGHADCVTPFACGLSVQGLIVMEALGWIEWAKSNARIDAARIAAIGNSGGGTLTMFLAALSQDLSVISSSGYPSTFEFIARKEKKHCHCNILPHMVGAIDMWQLYGLFAPRPLLVFQGEEDNLFPLDLFHATARKIRHAYEMTNASNKFQHEVMPSGHSWDNKKRFLISEFLSKALHLRPAEALKNDCVAEIKTPCLKSWPDTARSTDDVARHLTGRQPPSGPKLWDVFPPQGDISSVAQVTPRGDSLQILAQYECFLADGKTAGNT